MGNISSSMLESASERKRTLITSLWRDAETRLWAHPVPVREVEDRIMNLSNIYSNYKKEYPSKGDLPMMTLIDTTAEFIDRENYRTTYLFSQFISERVSYETFAPDLEDRFKQKANILRFLLYFLNKNAEDFPKTDDEATSLIRSAFFDFIENIVRADVKKSVQTVKLTAQELRVLRAGEEEVND